MTDDSMSYSLGFKQKKAARKPLFTLFFNLIFD